MKEWKIEGQNEFDFSECYLSNYPPLDLKEYEGDRNYRFYELQNKLLLDYNKNGEINKKILWQMFPIIEGVVSSLAKKNICRGCNVPNFDAKAFEASLRVLGYYERFPYFQAKKIENVAYWKVKEVFLDGNLQLNERAKGFDYIVELEIEQTKKGAKKPEQKTRGEIRKEKLEDQEQKELIEFSNWLRKHKK